MDTLPYDLVVKIRRLVTDLNAQPKQLLADIRDFYESRERIINKYYYTWIIQLEEHPPEHMDWLIGDVYFFLNESRHICYTNTNIRLPTVSEKLEKVLSRNFVPLNLEALRKKSVESEFNILWALMTPGERTLS